MAGGSAVAVRLEVHDDSYTEAASVAAGVPRSPLPGKLGGVQES